MRTTVETLLEFWRPVEQFEELVDVVELVRELGGVLVQGNWRSAGFGWWLRQAGMRRSVRGNKGRVAADAGASAEQCSAGAGEWGDWGER